MFEVSRSILFIQFYNINNFVFISIFPFLGYSHLVCSFPFWHWRNLFRWLGAKTQNSAYWTLPTRLCLPHIPATGHLGHEVEAKYFPRGLKFSPPIKKDSPTFSYLCCQRVFIWTFWNFQYVFIIILTLWPLLPIYLKSLIKLPCSFECFLIWAGKQGELIGWGEDNESFWVRLFSICLFYIF